MATVFVMLDLDANARLGEGELKELSQLLRIAARDLRSLPEPIEDRRKRLQAVQEELYSLVLRLRGAN